MLPAIVPAKARPPRKLAQVVEPPELDPPELDPAAGAAAAGVLAAGVDEDVELSVEVLELGVDDSFLLLEPE